MLSSPTVIVTQLIPNPLVYWLPNISKVVPVSCPKFANLVQLSHGRTKRLLIGMMLTMTSRADDQIVLEFFCGRFNDPQVTTFSAELVSFLISIFVNVVQMPPYAS